MRWVFACLLLAGCAGPHITAATPAGGIVSSYGWQPNKALMVAQGYCSKLGKSALVTQQNDLQDQMMFECK